jgi:transposase
VPVPWSEITLMSERLEFVRRVLQRRESMAELCAEFCVSEKTGYKWMARFRGNGAAGLEDRSHAPHQVHRMADPVATALLAIRAAHPTWGPRKLLAYAAARDPAAAWPAPSSVGALLKRAGLVRARRVRPCGGFASAFNPNASSPGSHSRTGSTSGCTAP